MTNYRNGPPDPRDDAGRPLTQGKPAAAAKSDNSTTNTAKATATSRQCGAGQAWRRRRQASYRCEPLVSGHRDPWQPWRPEKPSEKQVDAYRDAVEHLEELGLMPAAFTPEARIMWSRGGSDRVTASRVVRRWAA